MPKISQKSKEFQGEKMAHEGHSLRHSTAIGAPARGNFFVGTHTTSNVSVDDEGEIADFAATAPGSG
jgi:hypothetical protein